MLRRFSKSSTPLIAAKQSFFDKNDALVCNAKKINKIYCQQPVRSNCKNCDSKISNHDFLSFGVWYGVCRTCGHLNGTHEDTEAFVSHLYKKNGGDNYKTNYLSDYETRVNKIYIPKVDFLTEVVSQLGFADELTVLDMGCGGGHFVRACEIRGVSASGYDPSNALITLGNKYLNKNDIHVCEMSDFVRIIHKTDSTVVSMIGVLEHVQQPREALLAFQQSSAKFLYISVPLFSLSTILEHTNQEVFPRQLSGGHTHLYTKESLAYMSNEFDLDIVGEWWFGTDMVDLLRHLIVKSHYRNKKTLLEITHKLLGKYIDDLQRILDKNQICSEVHVIFKKAKN